MPAKKGRLSRHLRQRILHVCVSIILIVSLISLNSCSQYDPALYPYDVLVPGPDVDIVGFVDGNVIVTKGYIMWTELLKDEIVRLRKLVEEK